MYAQDDSNRINVEISTDILESPLRNYGGERASAISLHLVYCAASLAMVPTLLAILCFFWPNTPSLTWWSLFVRMNRSRRSGGRRSRFVVVTAVVLTLCVAVRLLVQSACFCQVAVFSAQVSRESPPPAPMFCIGSGISCARINCSVGVDVLQCASCAGSVARERMAVEIRSKLGMAPSRNIQSPGSEAVALLGLLPCWLA